MAFVPPDFIVPLTLGTPQFRLEPLGPEHNEADYDAWSSSKEHIHATRGFEDSSWPDDRGFEENLRDLRRHADDFAKRKGFTYTVLDAQGDVVGCVYMYPSQDETHDAHVTSWVRASRADLDGPLRLAVDGWLRSDWPFERVRYAV
jgi:hypothetical protein